MAQSKSKIISIRLNAAQIQQAEKKAFEQGEKQLSLLLKKLLLDYLSEDQKTESLESHSANELNTKLLQNNFAAAENLRKFFMLSFGFLFKATNSESEFKTLIENIEREWEQIAANNELLFKEIFLQAKQVHPLQASDNTPNRQDSLQDIQADEIEFNDLFSNENYKIVEPSAASQNQQRAFNDVVNECKQIQ